MKKAFLLGIIYFSVFFVPIAVAENDDFKKAIMADCLLSQGNLGIMVYNSKKYLVSVGGSKIKDNTPEKKLKAQKEAKLGAEAALTRFIYDVQISSYESLTSKHVIKTFSQDGKQKKISREEEDQYLEIIKAKSEGILKNIIYLGKWKSNDNKLYYYAVAIQILE